MMAQVLREKQKRMDCEKGTGNIALCAMVRMNSDEKRKRSHKLKCVTDTFENQANKDYLIQTMRGLQNTFFCPETFYRMTIFLHAT